MGSLTFEQPDQERFRCLALAYEALRRGGNIPCVLNAANEEVVAAFLSDRIRFCDIPELVSRVVETCSEAATRHSYEDILAYDRLAREEVQRIMSHMPSSV